MVSTGWCRAADHEHSMRRVLLCGVLGCTAAFVQGARADEGFGESSATAIAPPPDAMVALEKPRVRRVAVPAFTGPSADSLRQVVLEVLSSHPDVELLGQPDLEVVARRIGAKLDQPADRVRLTNELGLYAWVDGDASHGE